MHSFAFQFGIIIVPCNPLAAFEGIHIKHYFWMYICIMYFVIEIIMLIVFACGRVNGLTLLRR